MEILNQSFQYTPSISLIFLNSFNFYILSLQEYVWYQLISSNIMEQYDHSA